MSTLRIAVLMTCHNRVNTTLQALSSLERLAERWADHELRVFLVDDGSTDGTSEAVRSLHPEVHIVAGSGDLYWAGGMAKAYAAARCGSKRFDGYLLVNDDVELFIDASERMIDEWSRWHVRGTPVIFVGPTRETSGGDMSYGGFSEKSRVRLFSFERTALVPGELTPCDTFNANFVLVPGRWFEAHGGLDRRYHHAIADLDLGLDARRDGVASFVFGEFVGICSRGRPRNVTLRQKDRAERLGMLFIRPFGVRQDLVFARKHRPLVFMPLYFVNAVVGRAILVARKRS